MSDIEFNPPPSVVPFFLSEKFISLIMGPVGCVSADTEYLTPEGWRRIDSYRGGVAAQWEPMTGQAEFVTPTYVKLPADKLIHFQHGYGLSQVLSPEHRMVYRLRRKSDKLHVLTAREVMDWHLRNGADMIRIPVTFTAPDTAGLPMTDTEIRLAVAVQADSYIAKNCRPVFNLKKTRKIERLLQLTAELGIKCTEHKAAAGYRRFYVHTDFKDKTFGPAWWKATAHQLAVIADEAVQWDGGYTGKGQAVYRSMDRDSASFIQYAMTTTDRKTTMTNTGRCWQVTASARGANHIGISGTRLDRSRSVNTKEVPSSDGFKYCFAVPSTFLILRHNNCVFVTGNSTKTTSAIMKIPYQAKQMAACKDGIRRSRAVVIRNTSEMLKDSTIRDFLKWLPDEIAGTYLKTEKTFTLRFDDVICEVLFRGLDDANDVRRLLSLQASFGVMDEVREINPQIFEALQGRVGRYPDGMMVPHRPEWGYDIKGNPIQGCVTDEGKSNARLWGATNPPQIDSWWEQFLESPPVNVHVTKQPSGLSPDADWVHHLQSMYYENLAEGKDDDWINTYIHGKYSQSLAGRPVFAGFKESFHVAKSSLRPLKSADRPLIIGVDFGLSPACTINQVDMHGRLLTFACLTSEGMGITRFIGEKLKPMLANRFAGQSVVIIGDPAGSQRAQTDERSCFDILKAEGFRVLPARTNSISARIGAVEKFLARQVDGGAGHLIDPCCTELIKGFRGGYRYKVKKNGETEDSPEKNMSSHCLDAHQYACLHADSGAMFGGSMVQARREVKTVNASGWT